MLFGDSQKIHPICKGKPSPRPLGSPHWLEQSGQLMESTAASLPLFLQPDVKFPAVDDCLGSPLVKEGLSSHPCPGSTTVVAHVCSSAHGGPVLAQLLLAQTDSVGIWRARQALPQVGREREREGAPHRSREHRKAMNKTSVFFHTSKTEPSRPNPPTHQHKQNERKN